MNIQAIVKEFLEDNHFDGLFNADIPCGCLLNDLMPCECEHHDCQPGYRCYHSVDDPNKEDCEGGEHCDCMGLEKKRMPEDCPKCGKPMLWEPCDKCGELGWIDDWQCPHCRTLGGKWICTLCPVEKPDGQT